MNSITTLPLLFSLLAPLQTNELAVATAFAESPTSVENQVELYDLRSIGLRRLEGENNHGLAPASITPMDEDECESFDAVDIDQVMGLIERLCDDEFEFEGRALWQAGNGMLAVRAPAEVHARVEKLLELLSNSLGRRIEVKVDIINHPSRVRVDESLLGVIDSEGADKLRRGAAGAGTTMQSYTLNVVPGQMSTLDASRIHEIIADYDIEVAQSAFAYDPSVMEMVSGTRLAMTCTPAHDGVGVTVILRSGDATGPPERVDLTQRGYASNENSRGFLEGPRFAQSMAIATRSYAFDSNIPNGKALSFQSTLNINGAQGTQVVILQPQGAPLDGVYSIATSGSEPDVFAINMNSFSPMRLSFHGEVAYRSASGWRPTRMHWYEEPLLMVGREGSDSDSGWEYLESQCSDLEFDQASNWILATRNPDESRRQREQGVKSQSPVDAVQAIIQRPETIQLNLQLTRAGAGTSKGVSCDLPLRLGKPAAISLGVEGTHINDFDVEIAHGSTASDPIARLYLDGLVLLIEPRRSSNGDLSMVVRGLAHLMRERGYFEPNSPNYRGMDQLLFDRLAIDQVITMKDGEGSFTLGDSSNNPADGSLRIDLVVR